MSAIHKQKHITSSSAEHINQVWLKFTKSNWSDNKMLTLAPQHLASGSLLPHAKHSRDQVVTMLNTSTMSLLIKIRLKHIKSAQPSPCSSNYCGNMIQYYCFAFKYRHYYKMALMNMTKPLGWKFKWWCVNVFTNKSLHQHNPVLS